MFFSQRRLPRSDEKLEEGQHGDLDSCVETQKIDSNLDSDVDEEVTISPPPKQQDPRRSSRLKLPIKCATPKRGSTKESAIPVPSPDAVSGHATTSIVSYQRGFIEVLIRGGSPTKARLDGQR